MSDKKKPRPINSLHEMRNKLAAINASLTEIRSNNRKIQMSLPGTFVKVFKKSSKLKGMFGPNTVIIDPDLYIYVEDDQFQSVSLIVQLINRMVAKMDLSTIENIVMSASKIKELLIIELDNRNMEYVFV